MLNKNKYISLDEKKGARLSPLGTLGLTSAGASEAMYHPVFRPPGYSPIPLLTNNLHEELHKVPAPYGRGGTCLFRGDCYGRV